MLALASALTAVFVLVPVLQSSKPPKDPRAAFEAVLDQASRSIANGRHDKAREALLAALAEHGAADYVVEALPGIQEDLAQCAFWARHARPKPADVVAGELIAFDARSGEIKLRYRPEKEARKRLAKKRRGTSQLPFESDFEPLGGDDDEGGEDDGEGAEEGKEEKKKEEEQAVAEDRVYVHPLVFRGPHSLEIRCGPTGGRLPRIAACMEEGGFYLFFVSSPARAYLIEDGRAAELSFTTNTLHYAKAKRVRLDVRDARIDVSVDGKILTTVAKQKGRWGQLGFYGFQDVEEVVVSGEAEPSWIEGLVDAEVERLRAEFEKGYDALAELPEAVRPHATKAGEDDEEGLFEIAPGGDSPDRSTRIEEIKKVVLKGDWKQGLALASGWDDDGDAALRAWYLALFQLAGGRTRDALLELGRLAALEPGFWPARQLAANLRADTHGRAKALEEARALVAELPSEPRAREWLATAHLLAGETEEARAALDAAREAGLSSPGLDRQRRVLARAVRGPEWAKAHEAATQHYLVRSDISRELCYEAAQALETMYRKLDVQLRRVAGGDKTRFRVFLFSGRRGYLSYAADVFGDAPEQTAGMYSPVLKQLLIWNLPSREAMLRTVRHEGFHQYFDQVTDHAPRWLNEGLAEYFEVSRRVGGKWRDGGVHEAHLELLSAADHVPLAEFLFQGPGTFYARAPLHYAQAWALVHFLLESGPAERERFDALLDGLIAGEETHALIERVFPPHERRGLEDRLREHVLTLGG